MAIRPSTGYFFSHALAYPCLRLQVLLVLAYPCLRLHFLLVLAYPCLRLHFLLVLAYPCLRLHTLNLLWFSLAKLRLPYSGYFSQAILLVLAYPLLALTKIAVAPKVVKFQCAASNLFTHRPSIARASMT